QRRQDNQPLAESAPSVRRTLAALDYRMPAEWEPHEATWIAWPHNKDDWPGKFAAIPFVYGEIVRQLQLSEEVRILVNGPRDEQRAQRVLEKLALDWRRVTFWHVPTDRVWTRDYGPMFVHSQERGRGIVNWKFNAWAKYPNWKRDNAAAFAACQQLG